MQVTETKSEGLKRQFKIAVAASEIETHITNRLKELARTVEVPGFRLGKAPISVLDKKYGTTVRGEVLQKTIDETSSKVISERDLQPAVPPRIEITLFEDGADLEYNMAVELMPVVDPGDLSKIKLRRMTAVVDQAWVDHTLERLAETHKISEKVTTKRRAKNGDIVVIDFIGKIDGKEFTGGKAEDYVLELGSDSFIPGFEDQLVGAKVGDHVIVKVTPSAEHDASVLTGNEAVFDVTIKELQQSKPAPIDDELARKMGKQNLQELKQGLQAELDKRFQEVSHQRLKRTLLDTLADGYDFEIPEGLAERELVSIWKQYEDVRKKNPEDEEVKGKSEDDLNNEFRSIAERRVRLGFLLAEVSRRNNLQVSEQEVKRAIMMEARNQPGREREIIEHYKNKPEALEKLKAPLLENKVVDFILENASIDEKKVSVEELMSEPKNSHAPAVKTKAKPKAAQGKKKKPAAKKAASKPTAAGKQ